MIPIHDAYAAFKARSASLEKALDRALSAFDSLDMAGWRDTARNLRERLESDSFKVLVIGEFKRGKSTFINALLGAEVLPAFATPCTAVINEIKWGERSRATLHFRNPLPNPLPPGLPDPVRHHVDAHDGGSVPSLEIDVEDLEPYVVIADPEKGHSEAVAESPYERVEIHWPLEICRNGVEIVDSPGLNEHGTRTQVTTRYLSRADAILFVMSCQALASESELAVVDKQIRGAGHDDIFFIANRFDEVRPKERERLVDYGRKKLCDRTGLGQDGVFFISALDALDGRLTGDPGRVERSGIAPLETALAHFLTNDRGRVKLLQPARELLVGIRKARDEIIPGQRHMLDLGVGELEQRYEKVKPMLEAAERRREQIQTKLDRQRERLKQDVTRLAHERLRALAAEIVGWADALETVEFSFFKVSTKRQLEAIAKEVIAKLSRRLEEEHQTWIHERIQPMVEQRLAEMADSVSENLADLLGELSVVTAELTGLPEAVTPNVGVVSPIERVLAAAGGFILNPVLGLVGATLGMKEMLKNLVLQLGIALSLAFAGVTNPAVFLTLILTTGGIQGWLKRDSITETTKKRIAEEMARALKDNAHVSAESIGQQVYDQMNGVVTAIDQGLRNEIQERRDQTEAVLADLKSGQQDVAAKRARIEKVHGELAELTNTVMELVFELAGAAPR